MSPAQPDGTRWPADGALDPGLVEADCGRPLSLYVHVPFCRVRCGYCDFNTYTVGFGPGAQIGDYGPSVLAEADLAVRVMEEVGLPARRARTVFFGGGTPTMLDATELIDILAGLRERIGIASGAEVTLEANPDTVTREDLHALADAGFTRVSFGMQSAVPEILATLDRTHTPERVPLVVQWAKEAGLSTSVDLIYGTPGESLADWEASLRAALSYESDHISAYALVVEEGTKMGAQVARGELPTPDPDDEATKYELADALLAEAGYVWYEISNFARATEADLASGQPSTSFEHASAHNLAYWRVCAGGTSRTRERMPDACARVPRPRQRGRSWARRSANLNVSCWGCVRPKAWRLMDLRGLVGATRPCLGASSTSVRVVVSPCSSRMD